eukprot:TRINITY_DN5829_c0_g1_i3.p1 TRINITY_DN5829_c0_g1~~TRINITY_DN5829_c0_g1_i3.p1  ORF type:complete len:319 (+),score=34.44 TRINITY_DN5829_c0_g1_i3:261-1217(+)
MSSGQFSTFAGWASRRAARSGKGTRKLAPQKKGGVSLEDRKLAPQDNGGMPLEELPADCLSIIFSSMEPEEVCQVASVSKTWNEVSSSDEVWSHFLSKSWTTVLAQAAIPDATSLPLKRCFREFVHGVSLLDGKVKAVLASEYLLSQTLKQRSPVLYLSAATGMRIACTEDPFRWQMKSNVEGATFPRTPQLLGAWWFSFKAQVRVALPGGRYTISWRMARHSSFSWHSGVYADSHVKVGGDSNLCAPRTELIEMSEATITLIPEWTEIVIGEVEVHASVGGDRTGFLELYCALEEHGFYKQGLYLDAMVIRPTICEL